ncbi:MAG: monovalent cation/H+ antiporter complex subunit F [Candidatus Bipolaricaulis sp.]|nr:monovalent cation/H+ antiporter complex subunit F [Candidatus Bipolaricaulis sp.]
MIVLEAVLLGTLALVLVRFLLGPTAWDRLTAANSVSTRVVLLMSLAAVGRDSALLLDVAVVYAALSFLGVVVFARTLERSGGRR